MKHQAVNRWLSTVALILGIIIMLTIIIVGVRLLVVANSISDSPTGDVCYDPGGGEICVPSDSYQP